MFIFLTYLISQVYSYYSFDGTTLMIIDESMITPQNLSVNYYCSTSLIIISNSSVQISSSCFDGFKKITSIYLKCLNISLGYWVFADCHEIENLTIECTYFSYDGSLLLNPLHNVTFTFIGSNFNRDRSLLINFDVKEFNIYCNESVDLYLTDQHYSCVNIYSDGYIVINSDSFTKKNVDSIMLYAKDYISFAEMTLFKSTINNFSIEADEIYFSKYSFSGAHVTGTMQIKSNKFEFKDDTFDDTIFNNFFFNINDHSKNVMKPKIINKFVFNSLNNFNTYYLKCLIPMPHEIFINCSGRCVFNSEIDNNEPQNATNLTIYAGEKIIFEDHSFDYSNIQSFKLYANDINIRTTLYSISNSTDLYINSKKSLQISNDCFDNFHFNSFIVNTNDSFKINSPYEHYENRFTNYFNDIEIHANKMISFDSYCLRKSNIHSIRFYSNGTTSLFGAALEECKNIKNIEIYSNNSVFIQSGAFIDDIIDSIKIDSNQSVTFGDESFELCTCTYLEVDCLGFIELGSDSFQNANINSIKLYTNSYMTFDFYSFQKVRHVNNIEIHAFDYISFFPKSFQNSNITYIDIFSYGAISFFYDSFKNASIPIFSIHSNSNITIGDSFEESKIQELYIFPNEPNSNTISSENKCLDLFDHDCFKFSYNLTKVNITTKCDVVIQKYAFEDNFMLKEMNIHTNKKLTVNDVAFTGKNLLGGNITTIIANETNISEYAFMNTFDYITRNDNKDSNTDDDNTNTDDESTNADENNDNDDDENNTHKNKHGSSHKSDDDKSELSAKNLENFQIQSIYLGISPNVYFNFNIFNNCMEKLRKIFGRIIPSPDFVHSAIWIGPKNSNDETNGAIFVYGKYYNKYKMDTYLKENGAKAYVIKLGEFKERYPLFDPIKLISKRNIKLHDFIDEVSNSSNIKASDYNWPTNNCQHFTAKLIKILRAMRETPDKNDWISLPKNVLNTLKSNEEN